MSEDNGSREGEERRSVTGEEPSPTEPTWEKSPSCASRLMERASPLEEGGDIDDPLAQVMMAKLFPAQTPRPTIGRFDLLEFLGEGGMGSVYLAYDRRLDRRVAVKFLRATDGDERAQARLLREAQALARLSHPNIVAVHEVWEEERRIYVAMEYVQGEGLSAWQAKERTWQVLLEAYCQAGEGLAAAHDADLVHRDFKPDNAIRREDGVVKVLDFGLARGLALGDPAARSTAQPRPDDEGDDGSITLDENASLTHTGAIMGTPVFMSPEQHLGAVAGPQSDQYSFCVALWEALYAELPMASGSLVELRQAVLGGERREPKDARGVPGWVRKALERGLSLDPDDRYPSMRALLSELRRDPARARRRAVLVVAGLAATLAGGLAITELRAAERREAELRAAAEASKCATDALRDELWDDERQRAVKAGVLAAKVSGSEATWSRLGPRLDRYVDGLLEVRGEACTDHAHGLLSSQLYDLQVACLDSRAVGLLQLTDLFASGDSEAVLNATRAVAALPASAACSDLTALAAELPPPEDPTLAAQVDELRRELVRAQAEEAAGKYAEAQSRADAVATAAERIDYPPLEAEAALRSGSASMQRGSTQAGASLDRSLWTALRADHHKVAAEAATKRIFTRLELDNRAADVSEALDLATALVERPGAADWRIRWLLDNNTAIARERQGDLTMALAAYRRALTRIPAADGGVFERAATLQNMAPVQVSLGEAEAGEAAARSALVEFQALYGPDHPSSVSAEAVLAVVLAKVGRQAEAAQLLDHAIVRSNDDESAAPPWMFLDAARIAAARDDRSAAREYCRRGEAAVSSPGGEQSPWMLPFAVIRARLAAAEGDPKAADVIATIDPTILADNAVFVTLQQAELALILADPATARTLVRDLIDARETSLDETANVEAQLILARAEVSLGELEAGTERLRELLDDDRPLRLSEPVPRALALRTLAEAEAAAGHHEAALEAARAAVEELRDFDDPSPPLKAARRTRAELSAAP